VNVGAGGTLFLYFSDHGTSAGLCFEDRSIALYTDIVGELAKLASEQKFGKAMIVVDACHTGALIDLVKASRPAMNVKVFAAARKDSVARATGAGVRASGVYTRMFASLLDNAHPRNLGELQFLLKKASEGARDAAAAAQFSAEATKEVLDSVEIEEFFGPRLGNALWPARSEIDFRPIGLWEDERTGRFCEDDELVDGPSGVPREGGVPGEGSVPDESGVRGEVGSEPSTGEVAPDPEPTSTVPAAPLPASSAGSLPVPGLYLTAEEVDGLAVAIEDHFEVREELPSGLRDQMESAETWKVLSPVYGQIQEAFQTGGRRVPMCYAFVVGVLLAKAYLKRQAAATGFKLEAFVSEFLKVIAEAQRPPAEDPNGGDEA
jgi:hypothetical protein